MIIDKSPSLPPYWAGKTLPLARGKFKSNLRLFLWASGGVVKVEMGSPLSALSIKTWATE